NANMALRFAQYVYVMENGRVVLDGDVKAVSENEDIKEFYLGMSGVGQRKSYRDVKHYRRRKGWRCGEWGHGRSGRHLGGLKVLRGGTSGGPGEPAGVER